MILFRVLVVLAVAPLASDAVAQDQAQRLKNAMNNVQQEMMSCAAFYTNYAACLAHSNYDQKTVVGMQGIADRFIDDGGRVAEVIGMTADAVVARLKVAQQDQMNLINRNCVNIASLTSRYQDRCEVVLRDFKAVVERIYEVTVLTSKASQKIFQNILQLFVPVGSLSCIRRSNLRRIVVSASGIGSATVSAKHDRMLGPSASTIT